MAPSHTTTGWKVTSLETVVGQKLCGKEGFDTYGCGQLVPHLGMEGCDQTVSDVCTLLDASVTENIADPSITLWNACHTQCAALEEVMSKRIANTGSG